MSATPVLESSLRTTFIVGAVAHALAALVFACVAATTRSAARATLAVAAFAVVTITAAVYAAQASGAGAFVRAADATTQWVAEWVGYTASLALIGWSLAHSTGASAAAAATGTYLLAGVGAGGALGLFVAERGAQVAVVGAASALYVAYFAVVWPRRRAAAAGAHRRSLGERRALVVGFGITTVALYVVPYVAGPPVANALDATAEHALYLAGNVLTKMALPLVEAYAYIV